MSGVGRSHTYKQNSRDVAPQGLEDENARLKKLLADAMLDNAALKDLLSKKW